RCSFGTTIGASMVGALNGVAAAAAGPAGSTVSGLATVTPAPLVGAERGVVGSSGVPTPPSSAAGAGLAEVVTAVSPVSTSGASRWARAVRGDGGALAGGGACGGALSGTSVRAGRAAAGPVASGPAAPDGGAAGFVDAAPVAADASGGAD